MPPSFKLPTQTVLNVPRLGIAIYAPQFDSAGKLTDFVFLQANPTIAQGLGLSVDEIIGKSCNFLFPPCHCQNLFNRYAEVYEKNGTQQFDFHYQADHLDRWFEITATRQDDELVVNYLNISEFRQAQKQHRNQAELLQSVVDNSPSGLVLYEAVRDDLGNIVDFKHLLTNAANAAITGQTIEYICSGTILERFRWTKEVGFFDRLVQVTETGEPQKFTQHYSQLNMWADVNMSRQGDGVLFVVTDVTKLKEAELQQQQQAELLKSVLDAASTSITVTQAMRDETGQIEDFRIVFANPQAYQSLGMTEAEFMGQPICKLLQISDERFELQKQVVRTGVPVQFERYFPQKDLWVVVNLVKWGDGFVSSATNTTALHRYQQQLEQSNEDLRRSNENLQQFAYVASHDLQEPLRKIQSFGDMLQTQYAANLPETGAGLVQRMQQAARRMQLLIQDLLAFSKLSKETVKKKPVSLSNLIQDLATDLELLVQEKNGRIETEELPEVPGDRVQLQQLFQNLMSNALKFSRDGVPPIVRLSSRWISPGEAKQHHLPSPPQPYWEITVSDNGIGFDEKYLDRIFQVFQRLHSKSEYEGTGIGLAICRKVIENHRGHLTASSQPGVGTEFKIYLPAGHSVPSAQ